MELGISTYNNSIRRYTPASSSSRTDRKSAKSATAEALERQQKIAEKRVEAAKNVQEKIRKSQSAVDPQKYLDDILRFTSLFNRKLKFSVNNELQQVVVKVVDRETDKVIKEIPPEALQRLHERMQEVMGLLIDEEI